MSKAKELLKVLKADTQWFRKQIVKSKQDRLKALEMGDKSAATEADMKIRSYYMMLGERPKDGDVLMLEIL